MGWGDPSGCATFVDTKHFWKNPAVSQGLECRNGAAARRAAAGHQRGKTGNANRRTNCKWMTGRQIPIASLYSIRRPEAGYLSRKAFSPPFQTPLDRATDYFLKINDIVISVLTGDWKITS
jgi:hypothetical protein